MEFKLLRLCLGALHFVVLSALLLKSAQAEQYEQLLNDVSADLASAVPCDQRSSFQIGVLPIEADGVGIDLPVANQIYEKFLAGLISASQNCFTVIDARAAFQTLEYLGKVGVFGEAGKSQLGRMRRSLSSVNFVAQLEIVPDRENFALFITRLTNFETGEAVFRATKRMNLNLPGQGCGENKVPATYALSWVVQKVYQELGQGLLQFEGTYFEYSNIRTSSGLHLENKMRDAIAVGNNGITLVKDHELKDASEKFSRVSLEKMKKVLRTEDDSINFYTGFVPKLVLRYGLCEGDQSAFWFKAFLNNKILAAFVLPSFELEGSNPERLENLIPGQIVNDSVGVRHFNLEVSSNFGRNPALEVGDLLEILVSVERNSWVYCFYIQSDGVGYQIFPNKFTNPKTMNYVRAGDRLQIPNRTDELFQDKFELQISDSSLGFEAVTCYATSENIIDLLPRKFRGKSFDPLTSADMAEIMSIFEKVSEFPIEKETLTLSVFPVGAVRH